MNNAKLTPWIVAITFIALTLIGPALALQDITADQIAKQAYWLTILALTISSAAHALVAVITMVAATFGIPIIKSATSPQQVVPVSTTTGLSTPASPGAVIASTGPPTP